ncbi:MAG TPA: pyridoxal phosphate-dependent aminotransferase [Kofleriaceae bacterium]|nr:pyridoxal phosphate-dependent aminotransferase [Kofleriaceae bacterium]
MPMSLSSRLDAVKPSITMAVTAKAAQLQAEGVDVISFGAGEPDFDTPDHIKEAARAGLDRGVAKYTSVLGLLELRKAIAAEMKATHGVQVSPNDVLVSCGAKHSLFNVFMAMLDEGDEVIIPAPYWVSYPEMVRIAGATPVIVETTADDDFAVSAAALRAAITDRTRALILNTPSNPTGAVYSRATLAALAEVVLERDDLWVISDDIYRSLVYGVAEYASFASISPEAAARTILVDGVSKTYAMTGWRIGYTAGPPELISAMSKIQGQSTSGATHIAQVAALAALTGPQDCVAQMRAAFDERRVEMVKLLRAIPNVSCREPGGAFYAFPDLSAYIGKRTAAGTVIEDDVALCSYLVEAGQVALVPGSGFGAPGFARLSYACAMDDIQRGLERTAAALAKLG